MIKVAVLFGGKSCEREISILTGVFAYNLIDRTKYSPLPVYFHSDGKAYSSPEMADVEKFKNFDAENFPRVIFDEGKLYKICDKRKKLKLIAKIDVALNCCHGGWGEGGGTSALMDFNGIDFASPPLAPSSVFLDKTLSKFLLKGLNIPTLDGVRVTESDYKRRGKFLLKNIGARLGYPVVVKPARLGSSIGITLAKTEEEAEKALETAFALDDKALIEKYLDEKYDVNCAAYSRGGEIIVSEPEIAASGDGLYSFADKYLKESGLLCGKRGRGEVLDEETAQKIKAYTKTLYRKTDLFGVVRVDYLVKGKEVYLSEVNTVPGSLAYYLFCERLTDARAFFGDLIEETLTKKGKEKLLVETGALSSVSHGGKKR